MKKTAQLLAPLLYLALLAVSGAMTAPASAVPPAEAAGATWLWQAVALPAGLVPDDIADLAVAPDDAHHAILATYLGLYETGDAGDSWTPLSTYTGTWATQVLIPPSAPQWRYVRALHIHLSTDEGATWTVRRPPRSPVCGLAVAPSDANRLYALACAGNTPPVLFRSDDGGQTWITPTMSFTPVLYRLVVSPTDPALVIASDFQHAYRSSDGGATWSIAAIGDRYNPVAAFDPQPPHTLYIGHWYGLLRSLDGGQTWQDSDSVREFEVLVAAPMEEGAVLGSGDDGGWHVTTSADSWQAFSWNAPASLQWLRRSVSDAAVLYGKNSAGLWRYIRRDLSHLTFLPIVGRGSAEPFPLPARQAVERLNAYRGIAGAIPLQLHAAALSAAQNHASYYMLNYNDPAAWPDGYHSEAPGKPGFTGATPYDRMQAAGFPYLPRWGCAEVMAFLGDGPASVDLWMSTVFHRVLILDADWHYAGYGQGANAQAAVDVLDLGGGPLPGGVWSSALPYALVYPADGQAGVPRSWDGGEIPNPLPPGAPTPVGYPITVQGVRGTLEVAWGELRDGGGNVVPVHPNPSACLTRNCYALIAKSPLSPNTTYTVHVVGNVEGVPFDRTWSFSTGAAGGE